MIIYKKEMIETQQLDKFFCDKCNQEVIEDIELQEAYSIRFTGGYASVFGMMNNISCDLCQECLEDLIGDFCIYNADE